MQLPGVQYVLGACRVGVVPSEVEVFIKRTL
jgi:hypothetical protein